MKFLADQTPQKLRGGYYTDPDIAAYLARWVASIRPKRILEPSCGDGAFLQALASYVAPVEFLAFDIDAGEALKARARVEHLYPKALDVRPQDFLKWAVLNAPTVPRFDAAVGNPPFVRYQYIAPEQQALAEKLLRHHGLPFTKHTNAWVPFVVGAMANVRPGGRLAMVVPSELLHVLHAGAARRFLLSQCSRILVIDPTTLWFEGTLQGVVLLLAEKKDQPSHMPAALAVTSFPDRAALAGDPEAHFERASFIDSYDLSGKWMSALLTRSERDVLVEATHLASVHPFADVAKVDVGIVTGANKFFLVDDSVVEQYDLHEFAHPMYGRSEHVPGVIYDGATHEENRRLGHPTNFLWFDSKGTIPKRGAIREYIELGEAQGLPARYKCRIREPWYAVPSVYTAPVGMLKRCHDIHRLILNRADALTTDTAYRVFPKVKAGADTLVFSFVNSLTALSAELEGRHYGGGVLELVPSEIEKLYVPLVSSTKSELGTLDAAFRQGVAPETILSGRQDERVLGAVGMSRLHQGILRDAWSRLRYRRQRTTGAAA